MDDAPRPTTTATPLGATETGFVRSIAAYLRGARADEIADLTFLRARVFYQHRQFDDATPGFLEIVTKYPASDVAEYAASLLLDALAVQGKTDALADVVDKMLANRKLLANRAELAATLRQLRVQVVRKRAEVFEAAGAAGDPTAYVEAARLYLGLDKTNPAYDRRDELLFNAAVCFERANENAEAAKTYRELMTRFPKSVLAATSRERVVRLRAP